MAGPPKDNHLSTRPVFLLHEKRENDMKFTMKALVCSVMMCSLFIFIGKSWADPTSKSICDMPEYQGTPIYNKYCGSGNRRNPNYDDGAAQRARDAAAAAAEAQRKRDAELEQQRIEAENKRRLEEIKKKKEFEEGRDAAASTLRGSTGSATSGGSGLRGSSGTADQGGTVLRGAGSFGSNTVILKGSGNSEQPIRNGSPSDPGSQLKSTVHQGTAAQGEGTEGAHSQAGKGFDTVGENRGTLAIRPDKADRSSAALAAKIPREAWEKDKDNKIGQLYGYYKKLSAIKEETQTKIADIEQRQKSGKEDPVVLSAIRSSLDKKLKDADKDQVKTEKEIKDHVENLGLSWNEGGADSATDKKTGDKK